MESKEFYRKINEYIKEIKKEEIVDFVNNILRKIPESKFEEILCMINMVRSIKSLTKYCRYCDIWSYSSSIYG